MRSSYIQPCGLSYPKAKQKVYFDHIILSFHFFSIFILFYCLMVLHDVIFNVTFMIWSFGFLKKFYNFHSIRIMSLGPINKKNSNSRILTNIELKIEPCVLNLIWKWYTNYPKEKEYHLIFMKFGAKKLVVKSTSKEQTQIFEYCNLVDPMKWWEFFL